MAQKNASEPGIRERNGRFQVIVGYRDPRGNQHQLSGTVDTMNAARRLRRELQAEAVRLKKEPVPEPKPVWSTETLGGFLAQHLATRPVLDDWSPATLARVTRALAKVSEALGDVPLAELSTEMLDRYYAKRLGEVSRTTVAKEHQSLHSALKYAVDSRKLASNPARFAHKPVHAPVRAPEPQEVRTLLEAAEGPLRAILGLVAATGLRRGEICGLRWSDVNDETVTVRRVIVLGLEGPEVREHPKNRRARHVDIPPMVEGALRAHRQSVLERWLLLGIRRPDDPYLFSNSHNHAEPLRPDVLTGMFIKHRNRLGLGHIRLHDLRHFHATELIEAGFDYRNVAERLGHDPMMTLRLYAHARRDVDRKMAAAADERLWG